MPQKTILRQLIELRSMLETSAYNAKSLVTCHSLRELRMVARNAALLARQVDALHQKLSPSRELPVLELVEFEELMQTQPDRFDRPIALQLLSPITRKWETVALFRERGLEIARQSVTPDKPFRLVDDLTQIVLSEYNPKTKFWSR
jgi:hypothetical protein